MVSGLRREGLHERGRGVQRSMVALAVFCPGAFRFCDARKLALDKQLSGAAGGGIRVQ